MSSRLTNAQREQFRTLLMKAIDEELTAAEKAQFESFTEDYSECREELQRFTKLKEVTRVMKFKTPSEETWDRYWVNVYNRLERSLAWILLSLGLIILTAYGGFQAVESLIENPELSVVVKIGILLTIGGFAALMVSVFREKLYTYKSDPYKEVQR